MGYSKETYDIVKNKLEERRQKAEHTAFLAKEKFMRENPEARMVLHKIGQTGAKIGTIVAKGGDVKENLEKLKDENLKLQAEFDEILKKNGLTKADIEPKYSCTKCKDTGYRDGFRCECYINLLKMTAIESLNRVSPLRISDFESFDVNLCRNERGELETSMQAVYTKCVDYARNFSMESEGLLMMGDTGLGKTHLSLAIAKAAAEKGYGVVYGSVFSFVNAIEKERFRETDEDTQSVLLDADLLILDDLGAENLTSYTSSALYNIIDTRIMTNKPTIISTNHNFQDLTRKYSSRFVSRVYSAFTVLKFIGSDFRVASKSRMMGRR